MLINHFSYGAMPNAEAERNQRLFAEEVLPILKSPAWETNPLGPPVELGPQRSLVSA